jgi:tetratricopeptide (TPR) repeat protein
MIGFLRRLFGRSPAGDFYEQALVCEREANHDGALLALDQTIQLDAAHSDALYVRGLVHEIKGDYKKALADLKAARKLKPTSVDCLEVDWDRKPVRVLRTGRRLTKPGHVTDEEMVLMIRSTIGNDMARIHTSQANVHYDQEEFEKAIEKYSLAISLEATWVRYYERGRAYCCARRFRAAIDDLRRAIESGPESNEKLAFPASAHYFLGKSYREMGELDQAVTALTKSIQLALDVPLAYEDRARAYRSLGDEARAVKDERKARELSQAR